MEAREIERSRTADLRHPARKAPRVRGLRPVETLTMPQPDMYITRLLRKARSDFDRLRFEGAPLAVTLVHRATNAEAEGVVGYPHAQREVIAFGGAGHREPYQRRDKNGNPLFRSDPIVDVHGNPITNSAGNALDFVMPASRTVSFTGLLGDYQKVHSLAKRAGRLVWESRGAAALPVPPGWRFSSPEDIWWTLIFEIAWAGLHPLVVASRQIWLPPTPPNASPTSFMPYDIDQLRQLSQMGADIAKIIPATWLKRLPDAFVSEIDNIADASYDAADYILRHIASTPAPTAPASPESAVPSCKARPMERNRRFAVALSFPGEHRRVVAPIAELLANALGKDRVFYDQFCQVELARPNLDLVLQNFYGQESDLIVVFVCGEYAAKEWCGLEWRAIRDVLKSNSRGDEAIMFLRLDKEPLLGLLSIDGYLDISTMESRAVADAIIHRWSTLR